MKKLYSLISKIGVDRVAHFFICAYLASRASSLTYLLIGHGGITACFAAFVLGNLVAWFAGYTKEWFDASQPNGRIDKGDLVADVTGGVLGSLWVWEYFI